MKTKLLTICLLLFTSQVFADDIIMKCRTNFEKYDGYSPKYLTYKYSKSSSGTHKIYWWLDGKWSDICKRANECKVEKLYGKGTTHFQKKSNRIGEITKRTEILDFVNKELITIIEVDWGNAADNREFGTVKDHYDCERVYD